MNASRDPVAVIGGGPAGLFQALYLAKVRRREVVIVEQQAAVGGILRSARTPWGPADQGVYIFQECGEPTLDDLYFECLPPDQWHSLEGVRRDIAGNYFAGRIDTGSQFPDLRRLPPDDYRRCTEELAVCAAGTPPDVTAAPNLAAYLSQRFGAHAVKCVHEPFARKLWKLGPGDLGAVAGAIVHMARVVAYDMERSLTLKHIPGWNAILGAPDQLAFPTHLLSSGKNCLYPRAYGTHNALAGITEALRRHGVTILTGTAVAGFDLSEGVIRGLQVAAPDGRRTIPVSGVLWASACPPLLALMGRNVEMAVTPAVPHRIVNMYLDQPPQTGPLYWLWSYDPGTAWVRFSSGAAYCRSAAQGGLYPVCVETHILTQDTSADQIMAQVEREMRAAGIISDSTGITGTHIQAGIKGYFVPSLANCAALQAQRAAIELDKPDNLFPTGQDMAAGAFFLPDVLLASLPALESV